MATQRTHYVDTDVSGGAGDGSSWANAFSSLTAWEAHANGDLPTLDVWEDCQVRGSTNASSGPLDIDGWTTDATHYISITVDAEDRHAGVWSDSKCRLNASNTYAFYAREQYFRLDGLQIGVTGTITAHIYGFYWLGFSSTSNDVRLSNCIFRGHSNASYAYRPLNTSSGDPLQLSIWNCLFYGYSANWQSHDNVIGADATVSFDNCTIINTASADAGIRREGGTLTMKNCYVSGGAAGSYFGLGANFTITTCASSDTTGNIDNIAVNTTNFTDPANGDYSLPSGSGLVGVGTDGPFTAPLDYTTDIKGATRASTWDIGAFEYVAAGGGEIRSLLANIAAASSSGDIAAVLSRILLANVAAVSSTPDIASVIARSIFANIQVASSTGDISASTVRAILSSIAAESSTPDISSAISRALIGNIAVSSETPDIAAIILRSLISSIITASSTPDIATVISRAIIANIQAVSSTPDIAATIQGIISLIANIAGTSTTPEIAAITARSLIAGIAGQSSTPDISAVLTRALIASIAVASSTPDITATLENLISLSANIAGVSTTPDITATISRSLSAEIAAGSSTPDILATSVRSILAAIAGTSTTPDDIVAIMSVLGVILDPSATSVTVQRTATSVTPRRTILNA